MSEHTEQAALVVTLPGIPPSVNARYRHGRFPAPHLTAETRAWQDGAALALRCAAAGVVLAPRTPLAVTVALAAPHLYRFDLDNTLKAIGDAVALALGIDDRYIVAWHVSKTRGRVAQTHVTVQAVE